MVYQYSTYVANNEGYAGITQFNFNLDHFESSEIIEVNWTWGDGTFDINQMLDNSKVYTNIGQYNVALKLTHVPPGARKPETYVWQTTITIKKPFDKKFLINTTADPLNPIIYARATKIDLIPFQELYGDKGEKIKFIQWDLGNGVVSNKFSLIGATYDQAGMYEITMLVYDLDGVETVSKQIITVEEYLNDSIKFTKVPPPTYAGHLSRHPFKIEITSPIVSEDHIVDLYAQFSRSQALLNYPTKYSFLRPQWRFLDLNLNPIKFIKTSDQHVRIDETGKEIKEGGTVVGVRGSAEFYFVDDWYNFDQVVKGEQCTTLWATLRSNSIRSNKLFDNVDDMHPGQANNTAQAWCPYVTLWRKPDVLQITSNGLDEVPEIQWSGSDIPLLIKIGYNKSIIEDPHNKEGYIRLPDEKTGLAHYLPNRPTEKLYLNLEFSNRTNPLSSYFNPSEYPLEIKYQDKDQFYTGGYYKTIFEKKEPGIVSLSASLSAYEPVLYGHHFNPFLWLPNPTNASVVAAQYIFTTNAIINSPQYFYSNEIETYKQFFKKEKRKVSAVKTNPNLNTALINTIDVASKKKNYIGSVYDHKNKLSGLYAVAALNFPTYHAWVSDVENDLIYRLTTDGKMYNVIKLSEVLAQYNKPKFTPHSMAVDRELNLFVALYDAGMVAKFDDSGNLIGVLQIENNGYPVCVDVTSNNLIAISCIYSAKKPNATGNVGSFFAYDNNLAYILTRRDYTDYEPGNIIADQNGAIYIVRGGHINRLDNRYIYRNRSYIEKITINGDKIIDSTPDLLYVKHIFDDSVIWDDNKIYEDNFASALFSNFEWDDSNVWGDEDDKMWLDPIDILDTYVVDDFYKYPAIRHLCLDKNNNLFFTYGYNTVGRIDNITNKLNLHNIIPITLDDKINFSILDGLAYNINHKIYVINSLDNKVIVLDPDTLEEESSFYVNPSKIAYETDSSLNLLIENNSYVKKYSPYMCSLRANGDWTGWRWSNKFVNRKGENIYEIKGECKNIWLAEQEAYKFFSKTENFDVAKYMRSFSFMPVLENSPFLFDNQYIQIEEVQNTVDPINVNRISTNQKLYNASADGSNEEQIARLKEELNLIDADIKNYRTPLSEQKGFFGSIFGTYPYHPDDLGVQAYDKIASFVKNTGDPDTCDISHLQEMMKQIKFEDKDFKFYFPPGLSRIIDTCSVTPNRLMGIICNCGDTFGGREYSLNVCSYCGREKLNNKGKQIYTDTYSVTAGHAVVLKTKTTRKHRKINTGILNNQQIYSLDSLASSLGLDINWGLIYEFYEYLPNSTLIPNLSSSNYYTENIIDWNNQQTTLPRDQDSEQWYKDDGLIDRMVNFELQKGLGLI